MTEHLEELKVFEKKSDHFKIENDGIHIINDSVVGINFDSQTLYLNGMCSVIKNTN